MTRGVQTYDWCEAWRETMRKDMARQQLVSIERMATGGQISCAEGELVDLVRSLVPASLH